MPSKVEQMLDSEYREYSRLLEKLFIDGDEVSPEFRHQLRVFNLCKNILDFPEIESEEINEEILLTAALFHDTGKTEKVFEEGFLESRDEFEGEGHSYISAIFVVRNLDLPEEKLEELAGVIGGHHRDNADRIETKILQDADNLDEIGLTRVFQDFDDRDSNYFLSQEWLEEWRGSEEEINNLFKRLNFDKSKKLAKERVERISNFAEMLEKELQKNLLF